MCIQKHKLFFCFLFSTLCETCSRCVCTFWKGFPGCGGVCVIFLHSATVVQKHQSDVIWTVCHSLLLWPMALPQQGERPSLLHTQTCRSSPTANTLVLAHILTILHGYSDKQKSTLKTMKLMFIGLSREGLPVHILEQDQETSASYFEFCPSVILSWDQVSTG